MSSIACAVGSCSATADAACPGHVLKERTWPHTGRDGIDRRPQSPSPAHVVGGRAPRRTLVRVGIGLPLGDLASGAVRFSGRSRSVSFPPNARPDAPVAAA